MGYRLGEAILEAKVRFLAALALRRVFGSTQRQFLYHLRRAYLHITHLVDKTSQMMKYVVVYPFTLQRLSFSLAVVMLGHVINRVDDIQVVLPSMDMKDGLPISRCQPMSTRLGKLSVTIVHQNDGDHAREAEVRRGMRAPLRNIFSGPHLLGKRGLGEATGAFYSLAQLPGHRLIPSASLPSSSHPHTPPPTVPKH